MPAGRPTKYRREFCEAIVEHCKQGYSVTTFAAVADVTPQRISEWCEYFPEFAEAVSRAKVHVLHTWEQRTLSSLQNGHVTGGQAQISLFMLKNFGRAHEEYRDTSGDALRQTLGDLVALATQLHDQRASQPALPEPRIVEHEASESAKTKP